ncbi:MAG: hypothetical protein ACI30S_02725 [Muribaculaceae bacterium]
MDIDFQDRIDDFLLNRMSEAEKAEFLKELSEDDEKRELFEFTRDVKQAICSRAEKLKALKDFEQEYERECDDVKVGVCACMCSCEPDEVLPDMSQMPAKVRPKRRIWLWLSGAAAVLAIGFFVIRPMFVVDGGFDSVPLPSNETVRGSDNDIFDGVEARPSFRGRQVKGSDNDIFDGECASPIDDSVNDEIELSDDTCNVDVDTLDVK